MAVTKIDISMMQNTGITASKLLVYDGSGNLPAVDGSQITSIATGVTASASDPAIDTNPSGGVGSEWHNTTSGEVYICTDATAGENVWTNVGAGTGDVIPAQWYGERGLFAGGHNGSAAVDVIDYINIASVGNAIDFGNLSLARRYPGGCSDSSRAVFGGGVGTAWIPTFDTVDYVTIGTLGNATDFGNYSVRAYGSSAFSNGTRGVFNIGSNKASGSWISFDTIEYVTIQTTGDTTDFGDLTVGREMAGSASNGTRGITGGGYSVHNSPTSQNVIDYVTIATTGNSTDFGDLTVICYATSGAGARTRGIFHLGNQATASNEITLDYVTISTTGNSADFGDLTQSRYGTGAMENETRCVFGGGYTTAVVNTIDFVVTATLGNANDFGDLTTVRYGHPTTASGN